LPECDEPWSPVSIGVDMTEAGAHVVGIYAMSDETSQIFYAKHHPAPQRKPLTDEEIEKIWGNTPMMLNAHNSRTRINFARAIEAAHGITGDNK